MRMQKAQRRLDHIVSPQDIFICLHLLRPSLHQVKDVVVALQQLIVSRPPVTVLVLPKVDISKNLRHAPAKALLELLRQATSLLTQACVLLPELEVVGLELDNLVLEPLFLAVVLGGTVARLLDAPAERLVFDGEHADLLLEPGDDDDG